MSIPIHPERGLDPHTTYCPRCQNEANEIIVGDNRLLKNKSNGQTVICPRDKVTSTIRKLNWHPEDVEREEITEGAVLPATDFCDSCKEELEHFSKLVSEGGVYWRCAECPQNGVIKKSEYADEIRRVHEVSAPEPMGVEYPSCKEHAWMNNVGDHDDLHDKKG